MRPMTLYTSQFMKMKRATTSTKEHKGQVSNYVGNVYLRIPNVINAFMCKGIFYS